MSKEKINVQHVAHLARLNLTEEEIIDYTSTIEEILKHVEELQQYDIQDVEPIFHAVPLYDRYREDEQGISLPVESVLMNAPAEGQEQIRVPKVVETA